MSSVYKYFSGLFTGIKSLLLGLSVTWKELWAKKVTSQYPENRDTLEISDRFRCELTMLMLSVIIVFTGVFASWKIDPLPKEFFLWFCLLSIGVFGFFISIDLFTMKEKTVLDKIVFICL